jgi:hypothetical protein
MSFKESCPLLALILVLGVLAVLCCATAIWLWR